MPAAQEPASQRKHIFEALEKYDEWHFRWTDDSRRIFGKAVKNAIAMAVCSRAIRSGGNFRQTSIEEYAAKLCDGTLFGSAELLDEATAVGQQSTETDTKVEANFIAPAEESEIRHEKDAPPTIPINEEELPTRPSLAGPPGLVRLSAGMTIVDLEEDDIDLEAEELKVAEDLPPGTKVFDNDLKANLEEPSSARALERITALEDAAEEYVEAEQVRAHTPNFTAGREELQWHVMDELCPASLKSEFDDGVLEKHSRHLGYLLRHDKAVRRCEEGGLYIDDLSQLSTTRDKLTAKMIYGSAFTSVPGEKARFEIKWRTADLEDLVTMRHLCVREQGKASEKTLLQKREWS